MQFREFGLPNGMYAIFSYVEVLQQGGVDLMRVTIDAIVYGTVVLDLILLYSVRVMGQTPVSYPQYLMWHFWDEPQISIHHDELGLS